MRRLVSAFTVACVFLFLLIVAATTSAQSLASAQNVRVAKNGMSDGEVQRSYEIQSALAKIAQDKDAFAEELIQSWIPFLDNRSYTNLRAEVMPLMQAATPWQLYGASLAGDFRAMIHVLTGKAAAGNYVNARTQPESKTMAGDSLLNIGATASQLVFTPITPCRVVDTRNAGARTGLLQPGVPRAFDLTTTGFAKGQGGTGSCLGLPSFSYLGWSANVTVTGYTNNGGLQTYPYQVSVASTSMVNFFPSAYAIANSGTLTGCYGCDEDVNFVAFGSATHLIVDVMGYYEVATGYATGAYTKMAGVAQTIVPGGFVAVVGAACPAGTALVGGAQSNDSGGTILTSDHNTSGTAWYEYVKNTGTANQSVIVYSICSDVR